jgi:hypothetical protein
MLVIPAYALPLVYIVSLFVADGRTPYDRLARTWVTVSTPQETPAIEFRKARKCRLLFADQEARATRRATDRDTLHPLHNS